MDKKFIILSAAIIVLAGAFLFYKKAEMPAEPADPYSLEAAQALARGWIENDSPTYVFDGFGLEPVSAERTDEPDGFRLVYAFDSRAAGYGDRSDMMLAQVITPHSVEVVVQKGELVSAVTDGVYDEMAGRMIDEAEADTLSIQVFWVRMADGQEEIVGVDREISYTPAVGRAALDELLAGPRPEESAAGFSTAIPAPAMLQDLMIDSGVAYADFSQELQEGVAGSARVLAIREQIESTLKQFDTVGQVMISINGNSEDILQP